MATKNSIQERLRKEADELYRRYSTLVNNGAMEDQIEIMLLYRTPPISTDPEVRIAADSLLSHANMVRCMESAGIEYNQQNVTDRSPLAFPVPVKFLLKYNIFASSFGFPIVQNRKCVKMLDNFVKVSDNFDKVLGDVKLKQEIVNIRKFTDVSAFPKTGRAHIDTRSGKYRSMEEKYNKQIIQGHIFYVYGNFDEVRLLGEIIKERGVGKKTNLGYGNIFKVHISKTNYDGIDEISLAINGRKFLHKNIPCKLFDKPVKNPLYGYCGFKPSYWSHQTDVYKWGTEVM